MQLEAGLRVEEQPALGHPVLYGRQVRPDQDPLLQDAPAPEGARVAGEEQDLCRLEGDVDSLGLALAQEGGGSVDDHVREEFAQLQVGARGGSLGGEEVAGSQQPGQVREDAVT